MIKRVLFYTMLVSLTFISLFNLIGSPTLPTWRIFNMLFVFSAFMFYLKIPKKIIPIDVLITQIVFFSSILLQCVVLIFRDEFGTYEINFVVALFFLLSFCFFFYILNSEYPRVVLHALIICGLLNLGYQLFQFFSYLIGKLDWVIILNQAGSEKTSNIYRVVGPFLGPSGFMSESGQLALFIGPLLIYLILLDFYKIYKLNVFVVTCFLVSLVITFSGGAFIQFCFIGITYVVIYKERLLNLKLFAFIGALILLFILLLQNEQYYNLIEYRVMSVFTGDSYRNIGAIAYLDAFYENFFFGVAPKASRFIDSDPNTFVPILLADHGIIGGLAFFIMYFIPVILAAVKSTRLFFLFPFLSLTCHLFLAYGTYSWPFIWIIYALVIYGLSTGKRAYLSDIQ